jgi:hypothetical protein
MYSVRSSCEHGMHTFLPLFCWALLLLLLPLLL